MATISETQQLYVAYFGRPADPAGLDYWVSTGITTKNFAAAMYGQPEFQQANANLSVTNQVNALYLNLFGRNGDTEGLLYWTQQINTGKLTLASIANDLIFAANNSTAPQSVIDKTVLNNKTATAIAYTDQVRAASASLLAYNPTSTTPWVTGPQFTSAVTYLATVTTTAPTAAATTAAVAAMTATATPGQTFTLTTGSDTARASRFVGDVDIVGNFALNTLNNGDRLTGSGSNAILTVTLNTAGNIAIAPTLLSNIATADFSLTQIGAAAGTTALDFVNSTGLLNVSSNTAGNTFGIANLNTALSNIAISNSAFAHTFGFSNAALSSTSNTTTITANNLTGAVAVNLNVATAGSSGYETINVASIGDVTNVFNVATTAAGYTTLNISGARAFTTVGQVTTVTAVNAATATGALTYTANAGEGAVAYTGGSAGDSFVLGGTYTTADTVNGGDGSDRLSVTNALATAVITAQTNITNIEVIGLTDGLNGVVTVNLFGNAATGLRFAANSAGASTLNYASGTSSLDFQTFTLAGGALAVNVAGVATTDVLNVTLGSSTAGNTLASAITLNGVETLNLLSQGAANDGTALTLTNTAATESLIITGTQNITFAGVVRADVINASAMTGTGALTLTGGTGTTSTLITGTANADGLTGSSAADIISGGAGNDTIANAVSTTAASAGDVLTGGAGFDTFALRGDQASAALLGQYSTVSQITDFVVGSTTTTTDILALSATIGNYAGGNAFAAGVAVGVAGATAIQNIAQSNGVIAYAGTTDLIKLTTGIATGGLASQAAFDAAIGTSTVTGFGANTDIFVSFYDTTNSRMVIGLADTAGGSTTTILETADVFTVIGSISMSATDYGNFANTNLAIIAA